MKSFQIIEYVGLPSRELARKFKSILNDRPSAIKAGRITKYDFEDGGVSWEVEVGYHTTYVDNLVDVLVKEYDRKNSK